MKGWIGQVVIGEVVRCWTTGLLRNLHRKCMYSVIQFWVLAGNVKNILRQQRHEKTIASEKSSKAQSIPQEIQWNSCGIFTWERRRLRFSNA